MLARTLLVLGAVLTVVGTGRAQSVDLLIRGGRVIDGTGNPWFVADVAVREGRIVAVGRLPDLTARRTIDARGKIVVPGFIDIHSHGDDPLRAARGLRSTDPRRRAALNLVSQGITTVVVNHDGRSAWPIVEQVDALRSGGVGPNVMVLVGHGTVRRAVMGEDFRRPATDSEVARMRALVRQAMEEGAIGLSAGLEYVPGRWSTTDELVALAEEIVPFDGVYIAHERSEGADPLWYQPSQYEMPVPSLLDAVSETIAIGERTGAVVVASHIKAKGVLYWGASGAAVRLIEAARARGVRVYADQYPYTASGSDGNTVLLPRWVYASNSGHASGGERDYSVALRRVLADSARAEALRRDTAHEIRRRGGPERIVVFDFPDGALIGQNLKDLAALRGVSAVDMAIALQLEGFATRRGGARLRGFSMAEIDVEAYARQSWMATASDAGIALPQDGPVHARFYGTFPRKLVRYALERGTITLEHAVRSATSLPAQILGLRDRGLVREGMWADLAVLDPATLRDRATFSDPHRYASGVVYVLVGGAFVVDDGVLTEALPGRVIERRQASVVR